MKAFIFLLVAVIAAVQATVSFPAGLDAEEWNNYKATFNKSYADEAEEERRMGIYLKSKEKVAKHNADYEKGVHSYQLGINQFSDQTAEEFRANLNPHIARASGARATNRLG